MPESLKLRHNDFSAIDGYLKQELIKLNKWPIPAPHPDQIVIAFLRQFDVNAHPGQTPGFDGWDLVVGFATDFNYAQLNSINRNQAKQTKHQEWTSWKQWALSHAEYQSFRQSFIQAIEDENSRRLSWLRSSLGQKTIEEIEEKKRVEDEALLRNGVQALRIIGLLIGGYLVIAVIVVIFQQITSGFGTIFATLPAILVNKEEPEPKGINEEHYKWLSHQCFKRQGGDKAAIPSDKRNYCEEMETMISLLITKDENTLKEAAAPSRAKEMFVRKCKQYISDIMGQPIEIMNTYNVYPSNESLVDVSYQRPSDGKLFKYECQQEGPNIVWRGVDIFAPGSGPGRWRYEDSKALSDIP